MLADTATAAKFEQDSQPKRSGEATQDPPAVAMGDTRMNSRAQGQEVSPTNPAPWPAEMATNSGAKRPPRNSDWYPEWLPAL